MCCYTRDTSDSNRLRGGRLGAAAVALWAAAVSGGWWLMMADSFRTECPADMAVAGTWPIDSQLPRATDRATLLVFFHPKCPCSQATLTELGLVLRSRPAESPELAIQIVATTPVSAGSRWIETPLLARSQLLPSARVFVDYGGQEARRFGAQQSGTVMLFDSEGRRRFAGGITVARGHEGTSVGGQQLARLLGGSANAPASFPTFGCRLVGANQCTPTQAAQASRLVDEPSTDESREAACQLSDASLTSALRSASP
jgi:hypothetical protein